MRLRACSLLLSTFQQSKYAQIKCYIFLLIWIVLFSFVLYWFLIANYALLPTSTTGPASFGQDSVSGGVIRRPALIFDDFDLEVGKGATQDLDATANDQVFKSRTLSDRVVAQLQGGYEQYIESVDHSANGGAKAPSSTPERLCNPPERIKDELGAGDENLQTPEYKLYAIIVLIRHGDRGPLTHVGHRNISHITCQSPNPDLAPDLKNLLKFGESLPKQPGYLHFIGPFHSFPKVPTSPTCKLGQLTQLGSMQQVQLGRLIRKTYQQPLFADLPFSIRSSGSPTSSALKIIAYSTRYRRTLQSLVSFLYGLLGPKYVVPSVTVRESQSITFCFNDCSCRLVERLKRPADRNRGMPQVSEDRVEKEALTEKINKVLGITKTKRTGVSLMDLLLIYSCHNASYPCLQPPPVPPGSMEETQEPECITTSDVARLITLIQRESFSLASNYHFSLLSAYGLLKEIINLALKMSTSTTTGESPHPYSPNPNQRQKQKPHQSRIAIFSGHDTTFQVLLGALGIFGHPDARLPPYASRLVLEFYTKVANVAPEDVADRYHFRAIYNGASVTHLISFCRPEPLKRARGSSRAGAPDFFCPLENLVRFLHEHYFSSFGNTTTNFRDACQSKP